MELPISELTRNQKKTFTKDGLVIYGEKGYHMEVTIRYDDECKNWHNSFSITWWYYIPGRRRSTEWGWCCHEEIAKHFPELAKYIPYHLVSSDGPMHYVANTMYHARDRDHEWKEIGEAVKWNTRLKFDKYPFTFKEQSRDFWEYLNTIHWFENIDIVEVEYDGWDSYNFWPNYSLTWFIKDNENKKWYKAPFKSKREAEEFLQALRSTHYSFVDTPYEWCKAVEPDLEAARSCAKWEDATLEQLRDKELLESRLPQIVNDLKETVESLWFKF